MYVCIWGIYLKQRRRLRHSKLFAHISALHAHSGTQTYYETEDYAEVESSNTILNAGEQDCITEMEHLFSFSTNLVERFDALLQQKSW